MALSSLPVPAIQDSILNLRDIPTLSLVLRKVLALLRDPSASKARIAELLKRDQVLTAKVLRLVNSSYFGRSHEITDIAKALGFLGDATVSALVTGTNAFTREDLEDRAWFDVVAFWRHSVASGIACERIARHLKWPRPEESFTCGLLHDLGKIALYRANREAMRRVVERAERDGSSFLAAETALGLPGHHVVGERLAEKWHLPLVVRKTIRYSPRNVLPMETLYPEVKPVVMAVTVADACVRRLHLGFAGDHVRPSFPSEYLGALGLGLKDLAKLCEGLPEETQQAEELFAEQLGRAA